MRGVIERSEASRDSRAAGGVALRAVLCTPVASTLMYTSPRDAAMAERSRSELHERSELARIDQRSS